MLSHHALWLVDVARGFGKSRVQGRAEHWQCRHPGDEVRRGGEQTNNSAAFADASRYSGNPGRRTCLAFPLKDTCRTPRQGLFAQNQRRLSVLAGRCCRTPTVEDSPRASMRSDGPHEHAILDTLPHDELVRFQFGAAQAWVAVDLAGQGHDLPRAA